MEKAQGTLSEKVEVNGHPKQDVEKTPRLQPHTPIFDQNAGFRKKLGKFGDERGQQKESQLIFLRVHGRYELDLQFLKFAVFLLVKYFQVRNELLRVNSRKLLEVDVFVQFVDKSYKVDL